MMSSNMFSHLTGQTLNTTFCQETKGLYQVVLQELVNVQNFISYQESNIENLRQYQIKLSNYYNQLLE